MGATETESAPSTEDELRDRSLRDLTGPCFLGENLPFPIIFLRLSIVWVEIETLQFPTARVRAPH